MGYVKRAAKRIGTLAGAVLAFHLGTQAVLVGYDAYQERYPSSVREEFREEFGFPLEGYEEDIEYVPGRVAEIAAHLHSEDMPLEAFSIIPDDYLRMPLNRQFWTVTRDGAELFRDMIAAREPAEETPQGPVIVTPNRLEKAVPSDPSIANKDADCGTTKPYHLPNTASFGQYIPLLNRVAIGGRQAQGATLHELKHAKMFAILDAHPEFEEEWKLASEQKTVQYHSLPVQLSLYAGLLESGSTPEEILDAQRIGFGDPYWMNFLEDVASLCARGEEAIMHFSDRKDERGSMYIDWLSTRPDIIQQVVVAQRYDLLPPEFSETVRLMKEYRDAWTGQSPFLAHSAAFLKKYPKSKYAIEIHYARGKILWEAARRSDRPWPYQRAAMQEWNAGLQADHKELKNYQLTLQAMKNYAVTIKDASRANTYARALALYRQRYAENDVRLAKDGVNAYLRARGVLP
jgi:hypothetical protein